MTFKNGYWVNSNVTNHDNHYFNPPRAKSKREVDRSIQRIVRRHYSNENFRR